MSHPATPLLKYTLLTNAVTSMLTGLLCIILNSFLSELIGLSSSIYLYVVGGFLLIFAADVWFTVSRTPINPLFVKMIIAADLAWVVGSFLLVLLMPELFTFTGIILIEVIAVGVLGYAVLQAIGLKQTSAGAQRIAV